MFRKLFAATLGLLILALAIFGVLSAQATRARLLDEISRRLAADAEMLKVLVATSPDPRALQSALQGMSRRLEVRFTVINADGRVIGFERLNYLSRKQRDAGIIVPVEVQMA